MSSSEARIDELVYSLYGLTREGIAIIKERLQERAVTRKVADSAEVDQQM